MATVDLYLRRSEPGEEDKNSSLENQLKETRAWCEQHGHVVRRVWTDPGGRSTTLARPVFQQAMAEARTGAFEMLVVWKYDRFSRVKAQQSSAIAQFRKYGVEVVSTTQEVPPGLHGEIVVDIYGYASQIEHENIVARLYGGRRARTTHGKLPGIPHPLYGYDWADADHARFVPDDVAPDGVPAHAPRRIVPRIYTMAIDGLSTRAIARRLTEEGVPSPTLVLASRGRLPKGRPATRLWGWSTVGRILTNPAYHGDYVAWGERVEPVTLRDPASGEVYTRPRMVRRDADDPAVQHLADAVVEPLVTREVFERAQEALKAHADRRIGGAVHDPEGTLLHGGVAVCGYCGARMIRKWAKVGGGFYRYYCATTASAHAEGRARCTGGAFTWRAADLDRLVWAWIMAHAEDPDVLRRKVQAERERRQEAHVVEDDGLEVTAGLLAAAEQKRAMYMTLAGEAVDIEMARDYDRRAFEAKKKADEYREEVARLTREQAGGRAKGRVFEEAASALERARFRHHPTWRERRSVVEAMDVQVTVFRQAEAERNEISWRLDTAPERLRAALALAPDPRTAGSAPVSAMLRTTDRDGGCD